MDGHPAEGYIDREQLAMELHDTLTHHLTLIALHAALGERASAGDVEDVRSAMTAIRRATKAALDDVRLLVRSLREPYVAVLPNLDHVAGLVGNVRAAGVPVELRVQGTRGVRDYETEQAAYRIVQESLTNAMRHGHGEPISVTVRHEPRTLGVEVLAGSGQGDERHVEEGFGLTGLRRRVGRIGGEIEIGMHEGVGSFRTAVRLPRQERRLIA